MGEHQVHSLWEGRYQNSKAVMVAIIMHSRTTTCSSGISEDAALAVNHYLKTPTSKKKETLFDCRTTCLFTVCHSKVKVCAYSKNILLQQTFFLTKAGRSFPSSVQVTNYLTRTFHPANQECNYCVWVFYKEHVPFQTMIPSVTFCILMDSLLWLSFPEEHVLHDFQFC